MKRAILWSLVAVNGLLVAAVVGRLLPDNTAHAQYRRNGDYMLVPGNMPGDQAAVVFVVDSANGQLGAMSYDENERQLKSMTPIDLNRVFEQAMRGQEGRGDRR
jgi:hypothetical protein